MAALKQLRLRAVVKEQAARIPIFGRALLCTGSVRVERTHTAEGAAGFVRSAPSQAAWIS